MGYNSWSMEMTLNIDKKSAWRTFLSYGVPEKHFNCDKLPYITGKGDVSAVAFLSGSH